MQEFSRIYNILPEITIFETNVNNFDLSIRVILIICPIAKGSGSPVLNSFKTRILCAKSD